MALAADDATRFIHYGREELAEMVINNTDLSQSENIEKMISLDVPLMAKLREVNFCDVLARNSQTAESLKKLMTGLSILEKYGRHLLKPAENRSNMWRHIKYNNIIYSTRVHILQGGREIMDIMGYSEDRHDRVSFPDNGEPDQEKVLNLVVDIILGKKELETYLNGNHPYPHYIEPYIGEDIVSKVRSNSSERLPESVQPSSQPDQKESTMLEFQPATLPALSVMETLSIPDRGESLTGSNQPSARPIQLTPDLTSRDPRPVHQASNFVSQGPVHQASDMAPASLRPAVQQASDMASQCSWPPQEISEMSAAQGSRPAQQVSDMSTAQGSRPAQQISDVGSLGSQQPIQQTSDVVSHQKALKVDTRIAQSVGEAGTDVAQEVNDQASPLENEAHTPSIACDICGENRADVICRQCDSKQLCNGCDIKWHKHPKRQKHMVDRLRPNDNSEEPSNIPGTSHDNTGTVSHDQHGMMGASPETFKQQKPWLSAHQQQHHQQQQQPLQQGYSELEQLQARQMYTMPRNFTEYSGNPMSGYHTMNPHSHQPYYVQGHPYNYQQYGQMVPGERFPQKEGMTLMYDPVSGQPYEVPSLQQGRRHVNTIHDPVIGENRQAPYFDPRQSLATSHMMGNNQSNVPQQRFIQPGTQFPPISSAGIPVRSGTSTIPSSNPHMISFVNNTSQGMGISHEGGTVQGHYNPPTPSVLSTPSPGTPLVSPISNQSDERNYISSSSLQNRSVMSTPPTTGSRLLPKLRAIPDLEKRRSRLEIDLMNLREDLSEWDKKINEILCSDPSFFQNEEYLTLNKKKRKHLHEISELESYQKDLEEVINERSDEANKAMELRRLGMQKKLEVKKLDQGPPGSPATHPLQMLPDVKGPGVQANQNAAYLGGNQPYPANQITEYPGGNQPYAANQTGGNQPYRANQNTEYPGRNQPVMYTSQAGTRQDHSTEDPPGLKLSSLETSENGSTGGIPEDVMRMLVLDQNPFDKPIKPKETTPQMNVPLEPPFHKSNIPIYSNIPVEPPIGRKPDVAYPPDMSAVNDMNKDLNTVVPIQHFDVPSQKAPNALALGRLAPDLQQVQRVVPPERSRSTSGGYQWECEHCTFINDSSVKACTMCYKTSDNPKILTPYANDQQSEPETIPCTNCTFLNKKGSKQCEMCAKLLSQLKIKETAQDINDDIGVLVQNNSELGQSELGASNRIDPVAGPQMEGPQIVGPQIEASGGKDEDAPPNTEPDKARSNRGLSAIIKEDQDQIYWEKKAAQDKFEKLNRNDNWSSTSSGQCTVIENVPGANPLATAGKLDSSEKKDLLTRKGTSDTTESTSSFETAKTSFSSPQETSDPVAQQKPDLGPGAVQKGFKGATDFTKTIEQIQLKRDQEQMSGDAFELMSFLKLAEKSDFEMREMTIALQNCQQDEMKPFDWLKEKWIPMMQMVEEMAAEKEKELNLKDVGDISREEAREALLHCNGDVEQAVKKCIEDRQVKFQKIAQNGQYAHEDILTALLQNHGDVDEALDQLNQSVIQTYIDRLWNMENNLRVGRAMLDEAAARIDDLNNSVCNSVVSDDGFLAVIRDMDMDRDRRIRMVFVEGKLMSWGRADIVIQILEQNILLTDDPLDCTLEDIIDAVRNCGDRRSSLVYLKQECETCSGLYPMSKIRNLGVCNCKLCESCLKQCFEIAIREKFVRNWGCPICDAPGLGNDDMQAADYFDFLHLVLERLVSKEIMDLYDVKLRDWHLQKDPNFRWCAHCAFGFIWDRPDLLGMTCDLCHLKTCFSCKIKWEDQHQGLSCEEFAQWKIDNDPEKQAKGVKLYLEENGIDCPGCKMRYSLAKGGCMHFKCPQCGYEFCSGCSQAFLQQGVCKLLNACKNKGLHCHHPRDCFYFLRDYDVGDLQKLLKKHHIGYNTEAPPTQTDKLHCAVMEQKEYGVTKKDEACNKDIQRGHAGLCESHFKEYLVGLINKNKIDPITIMKLKDIKILIERNEVGLPELRPNDNEAGYRNRLMQFVKERFRLHR